MKTFYLQATSFLGLLLLLQVSCSTGTGTQNPEEKIILTPKPSPSPRINGTKVFGVRPGSPFLFTIPATGTRPMKYEVLDLPAGLTCDSETGRISGEIETPGEYPTTVKVSNSPVTEERGLGIVWVNQLALTPHMGWNC